MEVKGKILVFSTYPSYRICVENQVKELRQGTNGRVFEEITTPQKDVNFVKHRAWVSMECAQKLKTLPDFGYGIEFILASDLKEIWKTNKKQAQGFIKKMHRMSVQGDERPPIDEMDIAEELATVASFLPGKVEKSA